jgi:predicted house-cleaning NTP pyrophosphatase (Maf/HAM1 superfamily)
MKQISQMMEMENNFKENNLEQDKALVEALFGKETLMDFDENQMQSSDTFFQKQQAAILKAVGKPKSKIILLSNWSKLAVAASFMAIVVTSYLIIQRNTQTESVTEFVKIEEIPSEEIEHYVNNNEMIAEIDWSSEINEEAEIYDDVILNDITNKDTNNTQ